MKLTLDYEGFETIPKFNLVCMNCANVIWNEEDIEPMTCKAFPKGIPLEIWEGKNNHTSPYPGDNGIMFTPK